jgi:hypothetical protein
MLQRVLSTFEVDQQSQASHSISRSAVFSSLVSEKGLGLSELHVEGSKDLQKDFGFI